MKAPIWRGQTKYPGGISGKVQVDAANDLDTLMPAQCLAQQISRSLSYAQLVNDDMAANLQKVSRSHHLNPEDKPSLESDPNFSS